MGLFTGKIISEGVQTLANTAIFRVRPSACASQRLATFGLIISATEAFTVLPYSSQTTLGD